MEKRKRGRETSDQKKSNNNTKKRGIMSMEEEEEEEDDFDVEISYKLENVNNFTRTEEYHREDDESGAGSGAGAGAGVFDFPWLKGSEEVNFRAEIDECLDSTFAASTSSYDYDDREIRQIATTTSNSGGGDNTGLFDKKTLRVHELDIDLDLNLDLDLIDQFFMDNLSNTATAQSSHHHDDNDQLKTKKIEDEQLKIDDQKLVEPKEGT
ncbi:hypothetical protein HAX54_011778 [Datura stramonium]|uniref:Uncharacterized protein n=1 Tax=Datura stramonium TaxID=4076 RepID=A0ABS8TIM0_DATST|nr:hypothetical protein [Datura stramonium]